jgi:sulfonate transport system permease protein
MPNKPSNRSPSTLPLQALAARLMPVLKGAVLPLLLILLAEYVVRAGLIDAFVLPAPSSLLLSLQELYQQGLVDHLLSSSLRVLSGFLIGASLGMLFSILAGLNREFEAYVDPFISAIKSIPSLAWIPLLLLWMGIDELPKLTLIALGAFFPLYTNTLAGIKGIDPRYVELGKNYQLSRWQIIGQIMIPNASPSIFTETSRPDVVIIAIILLACMGQISDKLLKSLERYCLRWRAA